MVIKIITIKEIYLNIIKSVNDITRLISVKPIMYESSKANN
jgi:hypothetical protein